MQVTDNESKQAELEFLPLNIKLLSGIAEQLTECKAMLCDYTTGGMLFGMRSLYFPQYSQGENATFVSVRSEDGQNREFLLPMPYSTDAIDELYEYTKKKKIPMIFTGLTSKYATHIAKHLRCGYTMTDELCDYVYDAKALATLEGSSYHTQRTNIRKLQRTYESWEYKNISAENMADARAFADRYYKASGEPCSKQERAERDILYDLLANLKPLCLVGGILYIDRESCGIAIGEIKQDMLFVHALLFEQDMLGARNLLCREFVSAHIDKIKYVNMGNDKNDPDLRRVNTEYCPIELINRCRVEFA